jgi:hypothetical protein
MPPFPHCILHLDYQIVLLGLRKQNLRLLRQARHVHDAQFWRRNAVTISTRATTHEAFSRAWMQGLEADVAFLPLCVVRARLDRDRDGLLIFVVCIVLFRVAAAVYFLADLLVPAAPVVVLACRIAVSGFAPHTPRGVVGQWRGAGGAICDDHIV